MKNHYLKTVLLSAMLFSLFLTFSFRAQAAPVISGSTTNLETCVPYNYSTNFEAPAGATKVTYNWTVSSGAAIIQSPNSQSTNITWQNTPDSGNPKVVRCNISYIPKDATDAVSDNATPRTITVKYITPPTALTISLNGTGASTISLNCGTNPITIGVSAIATEPATGVVLNWSIPAGWTLNSGQGTTSISVTPTAQTGGTVTLQYRRSDSNVCVGTKTLTITRPVPPLPLFADTDPGCDGIAEVKVRNPVANATYTWTIPAGWSISGNATGPEITVFYPSSITSGTFPIKVYATGNSTGCVSAEATFNLQIGLLTPNPVMTTSNCDGNDLYVCATPVKGAVSRMWMGRVGSEDVELTESSDWCVFIPYATTLWVELYTYDCTGAYKMKRRYIQYANCFPEYSVAVYPNPASDYVVVEATSANAKTAVTDETTANAQVKLIDKDGKTLKSGKFKEGKLRFNTNDLPKDTYIIQVIDKKKVTNQQIIVIN